MEIKEKKLEVEKLEEYFDFPGIFEEFAEFIPIQFNCDTPLKELIDIQQSSKKFYKIITWFDIDGLPLITEDKLLSQEFLIPSYPITDINFTKKEAESFKEYLCNKYETCGELNDELLEYYDLFAFPYELFMCEYEKFIIKEK